MRTRALAYIMSGVVIGWLLQMLVAPDPGAEPQDYQLTTQHLEKLNRIRQIEWNSEPRRVAPRAAKASVPADSFEQQLERDRDSWDEPEGSLDRFYALVDELIQLQRFPEAFNLIYERRLYLSGDQEAKILKFARDKVEEAERTLVRDSLFQSVVELYSMLVNMEPDNSWYYLRLAHWLIVVGDLEGAELSLSALNNSVGQQAEIEELRGRIAKSRETGSDTGVGVPLEKVGEHFIVTVDIDGNPARLMIDTGATMTILKDSFIEELDLTEGISIRPMTMNSAGGRVEGYAFNVSSFYIGSLVMEDIEIGAMELPKFKFDGLLGMNVLSNYQFYIDQQGPLLFLE